MPSLPIPTLLYLTLLIGSLLYAGFKLTLRRLRPPEREPEPPVLVPFHSAVRNGLRVRAELDAIGARTVDIGTELAQRPTVNLSTYRRAEPGS